MPRPVWWGTILAIIGYLVFRPANLAEYVGVTTGLICVWLTVLESIWGWPFGMVNAAAFVVMFWQVKLYSDLYLNVIFFVSSGYGWYQWLYGGERRAELSISRLSRRGRWVAVGAGVVGTVATGWWFASYTDASVPYLDAMTTAFSLVAQALLTRKILETWCFWIFVDLACIGIYLYKSLWLTAGLYCLFLALAVAGLRRWLAAMAGETTRAAE